jgi:MFS transporter, DHA2 family, multidrug resistance protein
LQSISLSGLKGHELAAAAGLSSFVRVCCGSFGASVATTLWAQREAVHHTHLSEAVSTWGPNATEAIGRLTERGMADPQAYSLIERMVSNQSYTLGAIDYFWVAGWSLIVLAFIIWFARPPFSAGGAPVAE